MLLYASGAERVPRRTLTPVVLGAGLLAVSAASVLVGRDRQLTVLVI